MKKRISRSAAIVALKSLFAQIDKDVLTPDEMYRAAGRNLGNSDLNKSWLTNRLTPLRYYGFVESTYTTEKPARLDKIRLTPEGRRMLKGGVTPEVGRDITLESITQDIREFEKRNPSVAVDITVAIKKEAD